MQSFSNLDKKLFLFLNSLNHELLNPLMVFISTKTFWLPIIFLIIVTILKKLNRLNSSIFLLFFVLTLVASDVTSSYVLKNIFLRLRPCRDPNLTQLIYDFGQRCGGKFGFVSSHASNSIAFVLFFLSALNLKRFWYFLIALPLLVGYSRIYLGVHFPGDIAGGFIVGIFWGMLMAWIFKKSMVPNDTISTLG
jgi:undecaprenyl-diphosphatase